MIEMGDGRPGNLELTGGKPARESNPAARGLGLVLVEPVGRAVRQAQATHHTLVGQGSEIGVRLRMGRIGHNLMLSFAARCAPPFTVRGLA